MVDQLLLRPLPYPDGEKLVMVYEAPNSNSHNSVSPATWLDWQRDNQTFSSMAMYRNQDYNYVGSGEGQRLSSYMISAEFFSTLDVNPVLGRPFRPDDDRLGAAPVVILGGGLWKR